ncbi:hypothetical protein MED222_05350 [Vibrio sp. MED222]|nr:hypothetical protein MED222_05350 [Vibrio sp. MED222]
MVTTTQGLRLYFSHRGRDLR